MYYMLRENSVGSYSSIRSTLVALHGDLMEEPSLVYWPAGLWLFADAVAGAGVVVGAVDAVVVVDVVAAAGVADVAGVGLAAADVAVDTVEGLGWVVVVVVDIPGLPSESSLMQTFQPYPGNSSLRAKNCYSVNDVIVEAGVATVRDVVDAPERTGYTEVFRDARKGVIDEAVEAAAPMQHENFDNHKHSVQHR